MSSAVSSIVSAPVKLLNSVTGSLFGEKEAAPAPAAAPVAPEPASPAASIATSTVSAPVSQAAVDLTPEKTMDPVGATKNSFATRQQQVQQRASGAGAVRSTNDADMLGFATPKKRGASRTLLG